MGEHGGFLLLNEVFALCFTQTVGVGFFSPEFCCYSEQAIQGIDYKSECPCKLPGSEGVLIQHWVSQNESRGTYPIFPASPFLHS